MSLRMCSQWLLPQLRHHKGSLTSSSCKSPLRLFSNARDEFLSFNRDRVPVSHSWTPNMSMHQELIRGLHSTPYNAHGEYEYKDPEKEEDVVMITVYNKEGKVDQVRGKIGDNLLYLCKRFDVDMEGACEASLACTTCHVYVDHEFLDLLPEPSETEEDLLDAAPFLKDNSRLGCQIVLCKEYSGMVLRLPAATKNFYVDGHKPSHH